MNDQSKLPHEKINEDIHEEKVIETPTKQPENKQPETTIRQPENAPAPIVVQEKSGGKGLAIGALVLSLLALGASGVLFVQGQNTLKNQELKFSQSLDKAALDDSENGVLLQNALTQQNLAKQTIEDIQKGQTEHEQRLAQIQAAYAELLKGRVNWLVDEVEVTLNNASQQLLLSGNIPMAIGMLENVEQRLNHFEQPELLPIKQAISQDLSALKTLPYINIPATVLHIDRLQSGINELPLMMDETLQAQNKPAPASQSNHFLTRTWENTVSMIKDMVEIRHLNSSDTMLLAPEQIYFIRENLRLRLLDARLALMQHNNEVYQNDLNAVEMAVKKYFNTESQTTQSWLKELGELKALNVTLVSDETLKNSINAVRSYQNNTHPNIVIALPSEQTDSTQASAPIASSASAVVQSNNHEEAAHSASEIIKKASETAPKTGGKTL